MEALKSNYSGTEAEDTKAEENGKELLSAFVPE